MSSIAALNPPLDPRPAAAPRPVVARLGYELGFVLFMLLNATLFVRPAEIVPALVGWNIYEFLILLCFAASFPVVLEQLSARSLEFRPITVCVLGLFLAVVLSHLSRFALDQALDSGIFFGKIVVYYLLFVGLVDTPRRLRIFLFSLACFTFVVTVVAVLQYYGVITLPNLEQARELAQDKDTGREVTITRLAGSGIFNDPNELGVLTSMVFVVGLYWLFDRRSGALRFCWIGPLFFFLFVLRLTQSRGALLAMAVGVFVFLRARLGWVWALLVCAAAAPLLLLFLPDRQTSVSTTEGTSQERIQIWSDSLTQMRDGPVFGIGHDQLVTQIGLVGHNSFVQCYAELGIFGGGLFVGAFALALWSLYRLGDRRRPTILDDEMRRMQPYLFGAIASWVVGMMSLTLCYIIPTYVVLGLALAYSRTAAARPDLPPTRFDLKLAGRLFLLALAVLAGLYAFVRLFVSW